MCPERWGKITSKQIKFLRISAATGSGLITLRDELYKKARNITEISNLIPENATKFDPTINLY
jgi:hypothetical protein